MSSATFTKQALDSSVECGWRLRASVAAAAVLRIAASLNRSTTDTQLASAQIHLQQAATCAGKARACVHCIVSDSQLARKLCVDWCEQARCVMKMPVQKVRFEVFGKVQGVNFRAYTAEQAKKLGIVGFCRNTQQNTVEGELQGAEVRGYDKMEEVTATPLTAVANNPDTCS